jgi:hypothetical protein
MSDTVVDKVLKIRRPVKQLNDPYAHLGDAETRPELNLEDYGGCRPFAFESRSPL